MLQNSLLNSRSLQETHPHNLFHFRCIRTNMCTHMIRRYWCMWHCHGNDADPFHTHSHLQQLKQYCRFHIFTKKNHPNDEQG